MVDGRVREAHARCTALVIDERVDVALRERLSAPVVELLRPGRWRRVRPEVLDERQPVGHESAAHDEHALVAQRRELPAEIEQLGRVEARHRDLEDRDVGLGVHDRERHVRAVVEAPRRLFGDRPPG